MRFIPVPIDDRRPRRFPAPDGFVPEADAQMWAGMLFWGAFVAVAVISRFL